MKMILIILLQCLYCQTYMYCYVGCRYNSYDLNLEGSRKQKITHKHTKFLCKLDMLKYEISKYIFSLAWLPKDHACLFIFRHHCFYLLPASFFRSETFLFLSSAQDLFLFTSVTFKPLKFVIRFIKLSLFIMSSSFNFTLDQINSRFLNHWGSVFVKLKNTKIHFVACLCQFSVDVHIFCSPLFFITLTTLET